MNNINYIQTLDKETISKLITDGHIRESIHPSGDLFIYNYTDKAVYNRVWTDETLQCRGLITDKEGNIVARPFPKFFNFQEYIDRIPDESFDVYEKLDGSLGILYFYNNEPFIATRGSFTGEQAIEATTMLKSLYPHSINKLDQTLTYLFEIIYPKNRVVVNYGEERSLTLLGVIDTKIGEERPLDQFHDLTFPLVKKIDGLNLIVIRDIRESNKEGFVIRFKSGFRLKFKFEEYVKLHGIVTQVTAKRVWEMVKENKSFYEFINNIPDELFAWIKEQEELFKEKYNAIEKESRSSLDEVLASSDKTNRKELAQKILKCSYPFVIFSMLDNKNYSDAIWKFLEPEHEIPVIKNKTKENKNG